MICIVSNSVSRPTHQLDRHGHAGVELDERRLAVRAERAAGFDAEHESRAQLGDEPKPGLDRGVAVGADGDIELARDLRMSARYARAAHVP